MTMASIVGARGQIVIEKAIREQSGIQPGWEALQVADNHVRIYFLPPEHPESLVGAATSPTATATPTG
jgi:bifunctional DNA-binding transcriptional regulator/antitoxin component of YhaV-PrlF toxin-antitoxin module